jgi:hypothetical protein
MDLLCPIYIALKSLVEHCTPAPVTYEILFRKK